MLLVIDNYDSVTFNLVQYLGELGVELQVHRNDQLKVDQALALRPERVLISPGPCSPREAGLSNDIIRAFSERGVPILGVCLGHYRHWPAPPREHSLAETALVLESHHLHVGVPMHERDLRVGGDPREG